MRTTAFLALVLCFLSACNSSESLLTGTWQTGDEKHMITFLNDGTFTLKAGPNALVDGINIQGIVGLFSDANYEIKVMGMWRVEETTIIGTVNDIQLPDFLKEVEQNWNIKEQTYHIDILSIDEEKLEVRYPDALGTTKVTYLKIKEEAS